MGKKQHSTLCENFEIKFPKLFNYEHCALLFIDPYDKSLFKFHGTTTMDIEEKKKVEKEENYESLLDAAKAKPIIVRLP